MKLHQLVSILEKKSVKLLSRLRILQKNVITPSKAITFLKEINSSFFNTN